MNAPPPVGATADVLRETKSAEGPRPSIEVRTGTVLNNEPVNLFPEGDSRFPPDALEAKVAINSQLKAAFNEATSSVTSFSEAVAGGSKVVIMPTSAAPQSSFDDDEDDEDPDPKTVPKRQQSAPPLDRDMWNQSLYLPRDFANPPERPEAKDSNDDGFSASPRQSALPLASPRKDEMEPIVSRLYQPAEVTKTDGSGVTPFSSTVRRESEATSKSVMFQRQRDIARYLFTFLTPLFFYQAAFVLFGIGMGIIAVLLSEGTIPPPQESATSGVSLWRWMAFGSLIVLCIPGSFLVVRALELIFWYSKPKWTTSAYYYVKCCRLHLVFFLTTVGWVMAWNLLIYEVVDSSKNRGFFYGSQVFWLLFAIGGLIFLARLARELSGSYFERTTFWSLVSENLNREFYIWACCPGCPVPAPVVLTYQRMGEQAIRDDPRVLRQCTKYLRKHCITAYNNMNVGSLADPLANVNAPIEIAQLEEMQDLGEIIFDNVWRVIHGAGKPSGVDEETTQTKLKNLRMVRMGGEAKEENAVRALFSVGSSLTRSRPGGGMSSSSSFSRPSSGYGQETSHNNNGGGIIKPSTLKTLALGRPKESKPSHPQQQQQPLHPKHKQAIAPSQTMPTKSVKKITKQQFVDKMFTRKDDRVISAEVAWATIFDPNKRGFVTPKSLKHTMTRFYNERVGLGHTLKDSQTAVDRLGLVYYSVAIVGIIVAAALLFAGSSSYDVWIGITSFFVTLAVVFGSTLKSIAENIVFIFFRHPYDVGDLLLIEGVFYSVRRLELLSTVLIKWNGHYIQRDNLSLSNTEIFNLSRSGLYWEFLEAYVDIATCTPAFINNVRQYVLDFINAHPDSYSGKLQLIARNQARPLLIRVCAFVEFAYRPVNLTKLFDDIGRLNECYAEALRKFAATEGGVGLGAVRACIAEDPVRSVVAAHGLFGRNKLVSEAVGL